MGGKDSKLMKAGFLGFVIGYILTVIAAQSIWLEMRINTALFIPIFTFMGLLLTFTKIKINNTVILGAELALAAVFLLFYSFNLDAIGDMAAVFLREGFLLNEAGFSLLKGILTVIFIMGNMTLLR